MTGVFRSAWACLWVSTLCLAGCAGGGAGAGAAADGAAMAAATTGSKDRVTASDETDASKRARVRLELASAYFGRGQMETALDQVKQSIVIDPNSAPAFNLRGLIYASLGDTRLADESFRRALQLNPRDADAMQNFAWYLCQHQRFDEADAMFGRAIEAPQYTGVARSLMTRGICQARAGKLAEAERSLQRSFEIDAASPATAVNLAEVLFKRGDLQRARFFIRRVNGSNDFSNAQSLWLAARIENRLGNREGVNEIAARLRSRYPQSRETAAVEQGRFDE